ncbi:19379_t:CDS:2 [Rhizophagus irregularis]|nr:19379_t:CDS:2 [Rhizophagus irregularis]
MSGALTINVGRQRYSYSVTRRSGLPSGYEVDYQEIFCVAEECTKNFHIQSVAG